MEELTCIVKHKESLIKTLESDVIDLTRQHSTSQQDNVREVNALQDSLQQNRQMSDTQESDLAQLKKYIQKLKARNSDLRKENKSLNR